MVRLLRKEKSSEFLTECGELMVPSSAKIFEWVGLLEKAVGGSVGKLCDMRKAEVEPDCGTPGCHGGWAAIALSVEHCWDYEGGAIALAKFLGFEESGWVDEDNDYFADASEVMCDWAHANSEIWGNRRGGMMFCDHLAFNQNYESFNAQVLIDWWRAVGERVQAKELAA